MKKKVDSRLSLLLSNSQALHQRSFLLLIGDNGKDQVVNLHYLLSKSSLKTKPKVLWCYKKELGFSTNRKKRMKEITKLQKKGIYNPNSEEPFDLFMSSNEIRYCYYKESHKILGQTFNLLVLQDFESLTPNILCRTIETVEGGGLIIILIKTLSSLKQLYTLTMDVHQRYRTEAFSEIEPRFNERFLLSLGSCKNCIVMDDELNLLPISSLINEIKPFKKEEIDIKIEKELIDLKIQMETNSLLGPIIKLARTLDQAKAVMVFAEAISEKNFRCTVSLTAARGRGKSAAIGLSIATAIASGFSNIFVTAPSPENLKTLFEFVFVGLEALGYKENQHYEIIQSTNPDFNNSVIRVNVFKSHRQLIQYVLPTDSSKITQADLVVIDEAAAVPLPYVKKFLGPYIVFLSSTVNGYEGTGRSLSLKLISKLREQNKIVMENKGEYKSASGSRILKEITLNDPIRYSLNDPIEKWLNDLLLLNATSAEPLKAGLPHPNDCELFLVNRDTLFSYNKSTEKFLYNLMSLFISSHYKNTPNDLQLMSDAPAHCIFVLLGPLEGGKGGLPDILCAIQVCLEGKIHKESVLDKTQRAIKPSGDLIPWTLGEQYQDPNFPSLFGARVVRIATHPAGQKMGYGSRALDLLSRFFKGELVDLSENAPNLSSILLPKPEPSNSNEKPKLMPILKKLTEVRSPVLDYLGVSFGLTGELFRFWAKNGFECLYIRQTRNDVTAEHSCIMIKQLRCDCCEGKKALEFTGKLRCKSWCPEFSLDFKRRFVNLLGYEFRKMEIGLVVGLLQPNLTTNREEEGLIVEDEIPRITKEQLGLLLTPYDLKRLSSYSRNLIDYHLILDLLPAISNLYMLSLLPSSIRLSNSQAALICGIGLQKKTVEEVSEEITLPIGQALALFNKAVRKLSKEVRREWELGEGSGLDKLNPDDVELHPLKNKFSEEVEAEGKDYIKSLEEKSSKKIKRKKGEKYEIDIEDEELEKIKKKTKISEDGTVIVERKKNKE